MKKHYEDNIRNKLIGLSEASIQKSYYPVLRQRIVELEATKELLDKKNKEILLLNKQLEEKVEQRTAQLKMANEELEAFSYSVSHDLRAPLRSIKGFATAILEDYNEELPELAIQYLQRIEIAGTQMEELIDSLLVLARASRGKLKKSTVNLSQLVKESVNMHQGQIAGSKVLDINIAENVIVQADDRLLKVVIDNLVSNAIKYSSKQEQILVEFATFIDEKQTLVYYIKDNGAGFDNTMADKLFTPFQRLHKSKDFSGTGIGLATVKRIISRHAGQVWADSVVGEGAVFYFTLGDITEDGGD